jgi:hypothetical protein
MTMRALGLLGAGLAAAMPAAAQPPVAKAPEAAQPPAEAPADDNERIAAVIRANLPEGASVVRVEMTPRSPTQLTGPITVRSSDGAEETSNCTATRTPPDGYFQVICARSLGERGLAQLRELIRTGLAARARVDSVVLIRTDDNNAAGYADVVDTLGNPGRYNCTATRVGDTADFRWRCAPTVNDTELRHMESVIRSALAAQGSVLQVLMSKVDDNRMAGFARVRIRNGPEGRFRCSVTRRGETDLFDWRCDPPGAPARAPRPTRRR